MDQHEYVDDLVPGNTVELPECEIDDAGHYVLSPAPLSHISYLHIL